MGMFKKIKTLRDLGQGKEIMEGFEKARIHMANAKTIEEATEILHELYDFIDGIEMLTDTEKDQWNGTDGLCVRTQKVLVRLETIPKKKEGKQNGNSGKSDTASS